MAKMGPGKVTATGGGYMIAVESPHEEEQGPLLASTYGSEHCTSYGAVQWEISISLEDIAPEGKTT